MVANTLVYDMTVDDSTPQTKANIIFYCIMKAVVDMQNSIFNFMPSFILMLIYLSLSINKKICTTIHVMISQIFGKYNRYWISKKAM